MLFPATIKQSSWHYRMVRRANRWLDMKHDLMENITSLYYWAVLVPLSMLVMMFAAAVGLAVLLVSGWALIDITVDAFHNPAAAFGFFLQVCIMVAMTFIILAAVLYAAYRLEAFQERNKDRFKKLVVEQ